MTPTPAILDGLDAIWTHFNPVPATERTLCGIRFVLCDDRTSCSLTASSITFRLSPAARATSLFASTLSAQRLGGTMFVAVTRPGPTTITPPDRRWFQAAHRVCAEHRVRLLGIYLLTPAWPAAGVPDDAL